jgi:hypothetical protein
LNASSTKLDTDLARAPTEAQQPPEDPGLTTVVEKFRATFDANLDWQPLQYGLVDAVTPGAQRKGSVSQVLRAERKAQRQRANRLASIAVDAAAVQALYEQGSWVLAPELAGNAALGTSPEQNWLRCWPLLGNKRCGRWYVPPPNTFAQLGELSFEPVVHFKSVDGHHGKQRFSMRFMNLPALLQCIRCGGLAIVDATRSGKLWPDALRCTLPLWCAVMNALWWWPVFHSSVDDVPDPAQLSCVAAFWLRLCCNWGIDKDEMTQLGQAAAAALGALISCKPFMDWFEEMIRQRSDWGVLWPMVAFRGDQKLAERFQGTSACRVCSGQSSSDTGDWLSLSCSVREALAVLQQVGMRLQYTGGKQSSLRVIPVVGISASDARQEGNPILSCRYRYVAGAGDDEESWSEGLEPTLWWQYQSRIRDVLAQGEALSSVLPDQSAENRHICGIDHGSCRVEILASIWKQERVHVFLGRCACSRANPTSGDHCGLQSENSLHARRVFWLDALPCKRSLRAAAMLESSLRSASVAIQQTRSNEDLSPTRSPSTQPLHCTPHELEREQSTKAWKQPEAAGARSAPRAYAHHGDNSAQQCARSASYAPCKHLLNSGQPAASNGQQRCEDCLAVSNGKLSRAEASAAALLDTLLPQIRQCIQEEDRSVVLASTAGDGLALAAALVWLATSGLQQPETGLCRLQETLLLLQCRYPSAEVSQAVMKLVRAHLRRYAR